MLGLSLIVNAVLATAFLVVVVWARRRIIEEKLATFAGCMAATTSGLAIDNIERRFNAVGRGYAYLLGNTEEGEGEMRHYLTRAAMLRAFRKANLGDMSEHLRLLAVQTAGSDDELGDRMLEYISQGQEGNKEPREIWGDDGLAAAELVAARKALDIYQQQITKNPPKVFAR